MAMSLPLPISPRGQDDENHQKLVGLSLSESLVLGTLLRHEKYAKVHSVVTSTWTDSMEAYVFEPHNRNQRRFFEKNVMPKLRKSACFVMETEVLDRFYVIVCKAKEEESKSSITKKSDLRDDPRSKAAPDSSPSPPPPNSAILSEDILSDIDPVAVVKSIYFAYCSRTRKSIPKFNGGILSTRDTDTVPPQPLLKTEEISKCWERIRSDIGSDLDQNPDDRIILPRETTGSDGVQPDSRISKQSRRQRSRPLPKQRDSMFIFRLAEMIAMEPNLYTWNGQCQPGYSFFLRHICPRPLVIPPSATLEVIVDEQLTWTNYLQRIVRRIPELLEIHAKERIKVWKLSIPRVLQIFGGIPGAADGKSTMTPREQPEKPDANLKHDQNDSVPNYLRWSTCLDWMVEHNFEGFAPQDIESLKLCLQTGYTEQTLSWMRRIVSHTRMHKWAANEYEKEPPDKDTPDRMLMNMITSFTRHEIIIGMTPLIERMLAIAEYELGYWMAIANVSFQGLEPITPYTPRWERSLDLLYSQVYTRGALSIHEPDDTDAKKTPVFGGIVTSDPSIRIGHGGSCQ
ncbi:hypothetical protein BX600DRAFT_474951 [Xylariales sp. PMI_506]|nr:hypothetical protein BX600DRAFT_474951 [Xylariales sp. PMI_506]